MKWMLIFKKIFDQVTRWSGFLATVVIVILMLDVVVDVCARWLKTPISGVFELNGLLIGINIFLGVALVQKMRKQITVTFLSEHLSDFARHVIEACLTCFFMVFFGFMCYVYTGRAIEAVQTNEVIIGYIQFPLSPMKIVMALGLFLLTIQLALDVIWNIQRAISAHNPEAKIRVTEPEGVE